MLPACDRRPDDAPPGSAVARPRPGSGDRPASRAAGPSWRRLLLGADEAMRELARAMVERFGASPRAPAGRLVLLPGAAGALARDADGPAARRGPDRPGARRAGREGRPADGSTDASGGSRTPSPPTCAAGSPRTPAIEQIARSAVRPPLEQLDFLRAHQADLARMRREIYPLARRLATRLTASTGRPPRPARLPAYRAGLAVHRRRAADHPHKPRRPHKPELVVLCDVSDSVASFAQFTLLLVYALREQFAKVRAFTFVDNVDEVTRFFAPGADVVEAMTRLTQEADMVAVGPHRLRPRASSGSPSGTPTRSGRRRRC